MTRPQLLEERLTHSVIGAFYDVYNALGFGFLEHLYATALERELAARGHRVVRERRVRVFYKEAEIGVQRLDMVVDERLVLEIKSRAELHPDAWRQLHNYLRATRLELGLLLSFGRRPRFSRVICLNRDGSAQSVVSA